MGQITRRQILDLDNALAAVEHIPAAVRFTLWVARTRDRVQALVREIRERGRVPEAVGRVYADYESARIACARVNALRDEKRQPVCDAEGQFVIQDNGAFQRAITTLQQSDRFREAYAAVQRQRTEWEQWVAEPMDVDLPGIAEAALPNTLTAAQVRPLLPWVEATPSAPRPGCGTEKVLDLPAPSGTIPGR